jgi:hypothetical protein
MYIYIYIYIYILYIQGGDAETVCSVGLRKSDGSGLLVSGECFIDI